MSVAKSVLLCLIGASLCWVASISSARCDNYVEDLASLENASDQELILKFQAGDLKSILLRSTLDFINSRKTTMGRKAEEIRQRAQNDIADVPLYDILGYPRPNAQIQIKAIEEDRDKQLKSLEEEFRKEEIKIIREGLKRAEAVTESAKNIKDLSQQKFRSMPSSTSPSTTLPPRSKKEILYPSDLEAEIRNAKKEAQQAGKIRSQTRSRKSQ